LPKLAATAGCFSTLLDDQLNFLSYEDLEGWLPLSQRAPALFHFEFRCLPLLLLIVQNLSPPLKGTPVSSPKALQVQTTCQQGGLHASQCNFVTNHSLMATVKAFLKP